MNAQAIANALNTRNTGQFFTVLMRRPAKTFKGVSEVVEKESEMQGILCDYANRAPVKAAVADGMRDEPELPSHIEKSFKIGNVRFWQGKNGKTYLPVPATGNTPKAKWFLNGEEVTKAEVEPYLLASETRPQPTKDELEEKGQARFFGIDIANILEVR